jgi:serine O-acetyltransferase
MQNPLTLFRTIREDLQAHRGEWSRPGFQTLAVHRFGNWTKTIESKAIRAPLCLAAKMAHVFCRNVYGIELPFEASVGRRVVFEHQSGIVVHGNASIGDDCILRQGCTLGIKSVDRLQDAPKLGDRVNVGCGAVILGDVHVGNDCVVGANAVITKDVPPAVTVVGNNKWLDFDIQASSSFVDEFIKKYEHVV